MCIFYHVWAVFGPCLGQVWFAFSFKLAGGLNFLRLKQTDLKEMMECLIFWTMSGPYFGHVGAMLQIALQLGRLDL